MSASSLEPEPISVADPVDAGSDTRPIVLLTRDEHANSRWLLDLEKSLVKRGAVVLVMPLSSFDRVGSNWRSIVNRVSDAAGPTEVKRTMAILRSAELHGVPTINGTACYAIGTSKILHHELFDVVGVASPRFVQLSSGTSPEEAMRLVREADLHFPLLAKPNSGGFGAGITSVRSREGLTSCVLAAALSSDGAGILQEYVAPLDGFVYRVFFLGGAVQRAVRVFATDLDSFNTCVCSTKFDVWECPAAVEAAVLSMATAAGADCGSVELMYDEKGTARYFDFNLLSTLPDQKAYVEMAEMVCRRR